MTPWTERSGAFSPLKATVFLCLLMPAAWIGWQAATGALGPRPFEEAIHQTGNWAIRLLVASLAVTPLRRILDWPKLILVRRMIGLSALFYALAHLFLYVVDLDGNLVRVASEIVSRVYLAIGFVALLGLAALGATSTDGAVRRMGRAWNRLHSIVYAIGVLAALHFFMQTKADVSEAALTTGVFLLLMAYRLAHRAGRDIASPLILVVTALASAAATAALEAAWYGVATGVPPGRVLAANLHFTFSIRPAWSVLAIGLAVALAAAIAPLLRGGSGNRGRRGRQASSARAG